MIVIVCYINVLLVCSLKSVFLYVHNYLNFAWEFRVNRGTTAIKMSIFYHTPQNLPMRGLLPDIIYFIPRTKESVYRNYISVTSRLFFTRREIVHYGNVYRVRDISMFILFLSIERDVQILCLHSCWDCSLSEAGLGFLSLIINIVKCQFVIDSNVSNIWLLLLLTTIHYVF